MKKVKRWRWYCDFCKKSSGAGRAMVRHEKGCTANPGRFCGMCDHAGESQPLLAKLTALIETECAGRDEGKGELYGSAVDSVLKKLEDAAGHCPACTLAAIRQAKIKIMPNWNFKTKAGAWWADENAAQQEREY